jgi:hypothetical protein
MMRVGMEMMRGITNRIGLWSCLSYSFFGFIAGFYVCLSIACQFVFSINGNRLRVRQNLPIFTFSRLVPLYTLSAITLFFTFS